jgi:tetrahydromethanopterin S-methyltransferase subunit G
MPNNQDILGAVQVLQGSVQVLQESVQVLQTSVDARFTSIESRLDVIENRLDVLEKKADKQAKLFNLSIEHLVGVERKVDNIELELYRSIRRFDDEIVRSNRKQDVLYHDVELLKSKVKN